MMLSTCWNYALKIEMYKNINLSVRCFRYISILKITNEYYFLFFVTIKLVVRIKMHIYI